MLDRLVARVSEDGPTALSMRTSPQDSSNSRSHGAFWSRPPGIDSLRLAKERFIESHGWKIQFNSGNCRQNSKDFAGPLYTVGLTEL